MCTGHVGSRWSLSKSAVHLYIFRWFVLKYNFKPLKTCKKTRVLSFINISVRVDICHPTATPVISAIISFSKFPFVSLSLFSISIYDALWRKPYLRFLQQCSRGFAIFYKAVLSPFQHRNTLKVVHSEGMDWAFTHLLWSSTNEILVSSQSIHFSPTSCDYCVL